ncbi:MAG: hypothetical protein Q7S17_09025 [Xanthobacteraceae bacterium]|nr:hypothetical protein [Xanthobacteraceae bacterium]
MPNLSGIGAGAIPEEFNVGKAPDNPAGQPIGNIGQLQPPSVTQQPLAPLQQPIGGNFQPPPIAPAMGAGLPGTTAAPSFGATNQPMLGGAPVDMTTFLPGLQQVPNNTGSHWPVEFQPVDYDPFQAIAGQPNSAAAGTAQPQGGPANNNLTMR